MSEIAEAIANLIRAIEGEVPYQIAGGTRTYHDAKGNVIRTEKIPPEWVRTNTQPVMIPQRWCKLQALLEPDLPDGLSEDAQVALMQLQNAVRDGGGPGYFFQNQRPLGLRLLRAVLDAVSEPWEGDDWEALSPQTKALLRFMRGRERVSLDQLYQAVWFKDTVSDPARDTALSKANAFLTCRGSRRTLTKIRNEDFVGWH